jgi:GntR family transcriptional regulator of vanillate catabolism
VREIYSCRALLESEAVRLIAMAGLPAEVDAALARNEAEAEALMRSEAGPEAMRERFLLLNNEFHRLLERACPNRTLAGLIARMAEIPKAIRSYFRFPDEELARSHDQHRKILAAIRRGDAARAGALMREHIWSAQDLQIEPRRNGDPGVAAQ